MLVEAQGVTDVTVLGGCGHVGLPLGLAFADAGLKATLYDTNLAAVDRVRSGKMPHLEPSAPEVLARTLANGMLTASTEPSTVGTCEHLVVVVGTPVDEHLNPDPQAVVSAIEAIADELVDGQLLVLRSTVFPGVTRMVERLIERLGIAVDVAFCPERIAEGRAMEELHSLPQIVAARTDGAYARAAALFGHLTGSIVRVEPEEAELAKLFTNSYRYIKFAAANQLYMMANDFGLDYERIRQRGDRGLSPGGRPSRPRVRRRALPVEGHHAAGGLQQQQLCAGSGQHADQRGPAALPGVEDRSPLRPRCHDRGHPRHGVQGRVR